MNIISQQQRQGVITRMNELKKLRAWEKLGCTRHWHTKNNQPGNSSALTYKKQRVWDLGCTQHSISHSPSPRV